MQSDPKKNLHCDLPDWEFASGYKNGQRLCVEALTGELSEANNRLHQEEISRRKVEEALNKRLRFETLLFDLSARFLKISPEEIDPEMKSALNRIREFFQFDRSGLRELARDGTPKQITRGGYAVDLADSIEEWLRRIAVFFDADRCSLRIFSDGDTRLGRVFDFCRKGLKPVPASLSKDELPWYMTQLIQGKSVVMERLESLPQAAEKERRFCLAGNIKSVLSVPMTSGKNIIGVFALASIHEERAWPRELVQQMRFVGDVFAGALARRKMEMELRERFQEIGRLKQQLEQENICLKKEIELQQAHDEMVGRSPAIREILSMIERVARTDATVLIEGETGAGKELVAKAVHRLSARKDRPLITVNCASLPPSLIESELFGREKGAYTGAMTRMAGRFEAADGATLFLDEIGELPLEVQAKLLRVIEEGRFERLGSTKTQKVDVRIVAATNRDLAKEAAEGNFRKDLYYRLSVFPIPVPPLRERPEDIPLLVWAFVRQFEKKMGRRIDHIPGKCLEELTRYPWPGNARELKNAVEHSMILCRSKTLEVRPPRKISSQIPAGLDLEDVERGHILDVLQKCGWRLSGPNSASEMLGLKRTTLQSKMKKLGIKRPSN